MFGSCQLTKYNAISNQLALCTFPIRGHLIPFPVKVRYAGVCTASPIKYPSPHFPSMLFG